MGQQACEKKFNITKHQRNANQNHNETLSRTSQKGCHQNDERLVSVSKDVKQRELLCTVDGNETGMDTAENGAEGPQKIRTSLMAQLVKNLPTMWETWV